MKYIEYRKYKIKLKLYKGLGALIVFGIIYLFILAKENGISSDKILSWIEIGGAIIVVAGIGISVYIRYRDKKKYLNSPLYSIDHMDGKVFEKYLKAHFENLGYRVSLTPDSHDYGADLVCKNKEGTLIIQAKRYKGKVGNAAIQEIVAAKGYYKADKCMVVTNSFFSDPAIKLAQANNVELWDRNQIRRRLVNKEVKLEH